MQALMICNGVFVSHRPLELIYEQELKLDRMPVVPPQDVTIDEERRTVQVGATAALGVPAMRAAGREGLGLIVLGPEQDFDDLEDLPRLDLPPPIASFSESWRAAPGAP